MSGNESPNTGAAVQFPYSFKTEDTAKGKRISIHTYHVDPAKGVEEHVRLYETIAAEFRSRGWSVEAQKVEPAKDPQASPGVSVPTDGGQKSA